LSIQFFSKGVILSRLSLGCCPPEDVGGIFGFKEFLRIMNRKSHPERKSYIEWYGSVFNPDIVNLAEINNSTC